jgi:predicted metal-binding membrane protein
MRRGRAGRGAPAPGFDATLLFVAGYLVAWTFVGLVAYAIFELGHAVDPALLGWDALGHEIVAGVVLAGALYQLTPLKAACLVHCRGPFMFLLERWREGRAGALRMGLVHGGWCVGCCWALMATLFALGVMSLGWMAFVAALMAAEKLVPHVSTHRLVAVVLLLLGVAILVDPSAVPGLEVPAAGGRGMSGM